MDLERLEKYIPLKMRRMVLTRKIEERLGKKADRVVDIVEGSNHSFPYQRVLFSVSGLDPLETKTKKIQISGWEKEVDEINAELAAIEECIAGVTEPIVKTSLELKYLQGHTWPKVSAMIYGTAAYSDTLRMKAQRYVAAENKNEM